MSSFSNSSSKTNSPVHPFKPIVATRRSSANKPIDFEDGLETYQFDGVEVVCLEGLETAGQDYKQTQTQDGKELYSQDGKSASRDAEKEAAGVVDMSLPKQDSICGFGKRTFVILGTLLLLLIAASFHFLFVFLTRAFN
jgi:hypothetical protein